MSKEILKSTFTVSGMTFFSRVLGFIRDMLIARYFGVDSATDAFFVAFKIPNFLRRLFVEGAFAHAFVPTITGYDQDENQASLKLFLNKAAGTLAVLMMAGTLAGMLAAPLLVLLFAPGFLWEPRQYELSVQMLQITMPYLFFISSVAFAGGILNTFGKFGIPALTPAILNVAMIAAAMFLAPLLNEPIVALAWGVFLGGALQLLIQFPELARLRLLPRLQFDLKDPEVNRVIKMMGPALFGVSVTQINLLLDTFVASFLVTGSVSWLYYSDRLVEFPLGILGVALATVILPKLARNHAASEYQAFSKTLDWGLRGLLIVGLPSMIGLMMLAEPILYTLFQYDEFNADDVRQACSSLRGYSSGLLGFMLIKLLVPAFTSRKDVMTPMRYGLYALAANFILNLILVFPFAHGGLAYATSIAAYLNAGLLLAALIRGGFYKPEKQWGSFFIRLIAANSLMVLVLIAVMNPLVWLEWGVAERSLGLLGSIVMAAVFYLLALYLLGFRLKQVLKPSN
ncbi:MAG: murein biosynthesis integral membrane protein MurJ [Methylicorpusculum sp.]|uniref:murein biosynthesis integral membrane protein MurJ n=1 Tax=Methylicorpusculum sp. TaxID=2713644 RepID=UPI00271B2509|nr:murein biosynthesis integral membrane protein MurJ [Methylicorpusculum sp.]MDO8846235.1 murein biosynthesis integral membrane protein MurJ [Methylicorpusculum sp.]MDO8937624.1 murein biosynthesis integral membrane protein MurJ [Methylicorpusculum sp.]MDP2201999.1 murein biosynthesis integral membrane protein MurJ [Methylicorpusculum sp.]